MWRRLSADRQTNRHIPESMSLMMGTRALAMVSMLWYLPCLRRTAANAKIGFLPAPTTPMSTSLHARTRTTKRRHRHHRRRPLPTFTSTPRAPCAARLPEGQVELGSGRPEHVHLDPSHQQPPPNKVSRQRLANVILSRLVASRSRLVARRYAPRRRAKRWK